MRRTVLPMLLLLCISASAGASVHKCEDASGRVYYQDQPCTGDKRATDYDPERGTITTIESQRSSRETFGGLITREETSSERVQVYQPQGGEITIGTEYPDGYVDGYYHRPGPRDRFDRDGYRDRRDHSTRAERERVREAEANVRRMGSSPVPAAPSRGPRSISEGRDSRTQTPGSNGSRDRGNNRDDR